MKPPLPKGWKIDGDYIEDEDGYPRYIFGDDEAMRREFVGNLLRGYGYHEHAAVWSANQALAAVERMSAELLAEMPTDSTPAIKEWRRRVTEIWTTSITHTLKQ